MIFVDGDQTQPSLTRRSMLRLSAATAASVYVVHVSQLRAQNQPEPPSGPMPPAPPTPPAPDPPTDPEPPEEPKPPRRPRDGNLAGERVGIIGAGLAGLAAAHDLISQGASVTILEGRERIGGRVHTIDVGDLRVDLGAEWIPHDNRHPINELARKFKLATSNGDTRAMVLYGLDGKRVPPARVSRLTQRFSRVMSHLRQASRQRVTRNQQDISMAQAVGESDLYADAGVEEIAVLDWLVARQITSVAGADPAEVSLKSFWMDQQDNWFHAGIRRFDNGFSALVAALAQGMDIRLAHIVEKIQYTNTGVRVTTKVGPFDFDRLVVTLPVAVLQAGDVTFEPALPTWKAQAIAGFKVGHASRLAMQFDQTFWPGQVEFLGSASAPSDQFIDWTNLFRSQRQPGLSMWSAAGAATQLEALDQQQLTAVAMSRLQQTYGKRATRPLHSRVSTWATDPMSRGAWAYIPVGGLPELVENLAKPVMRRLFFAGDATEKKYFHTAGAAVLSGVRAARDISRMRSMEL